MLHLRQKHAHGCVPCIALALGNKLGLTQLRRYVRTHGWSDPLYRPRHAA